jgi:hypothetical protein
VDASVVVSAEQASVCQVGVAALRPRNIMVRVAQGGRSVAVLGGAAPVADGHRSALGSGVEAASASDIEDFGLATEDHGDDPSRAGKPTGFGCSDLATGVEGAHPGGVEACDELLMGHRDHDRGRAATGTGQRLRGDGFEELAQREAGAHRPGRDVSQLVESRGHASGEVGDRVGPVQKLAAHDPNLEATTDSF